MFEHTRTAEIVITEKNVDSYETFNSMCEASERIIQYKKFILNQQNEHARQLEELRVEYSNNASESYKKTKEHNIILNKELAALKEEYTNIQKRHELLKKKRKEFVESNDIIIDKDKLVLQSILDVICTEYNLTEKQMRDKDRAAQKVEARQLFFYFAGKHKMTSIMIGEFLSRDHSTVIYSKRKVDNTISVDKAFAAKIEELKLRLTYEW